ncbi:MAG: hypothetical protein K2X64_03070 [Rhodocyclaceae bacterium]|nr:hypothetical protein [Rhodocyclaceae bacterium]
MSDIVTAGSAGKAISAACSLALTGCFTGLDMFSLLGALAGMGLSMSKQERMHWARLFIVALSVLIFSVGATWFIAEALPAGLSRLDIEHFEIGRGRMMVAWLLAYFAQSNILPLVEKWLEKIQPNPRRPDA